MSFVTLLVQNPGFEPAFTFDHAMNHRAYLGQMSPLDQYTVVPYFIDPPQDQGISASQWHLNHQQSHNDALHAIPNNWNFYATLPLPDPDIGLFIGQNLRDTSFDNQGQKLWWTFANHMEHYIANAATLPASTEPPFQTFPFW
jgi:hypothetical protein